MSQILPSRAADRVQGRIRPRVIATTHTKSKAHDAHTRHLALTVSTQLRVLIVAGIGYLVLASHILVLK